MRISFVIPTVDRQDSLEKLLSSLQSQTRLPDEVVIVFQGDGDYESTVARYPRLSVKLVKSDVRSLTKARNLGVRASFGDIVGFLDDDIVAAPDYTEKILSFFSDQPTALGVQGRITDFELGHARKVGGNRRVYRLYNLFAKLFLLNNSSRTNKLLRSGRNQYASRVKQVMNCEWLSGIGNYRRQVFEKFWFDENLRGYALGEDKLFSYPIFENYPGGLFVDPAVKCEHHHADFGRPQSRAWVKMKVRYTYYLWNKLFRKQGLGAFIGYWWANLGDLLVVFFSVLFRQNTIKVFWWHILEYADIIFSWHHSDPVLAEEEFLNYE